MEEEDRAAGVGVEPDLRLGDGALEGTNVGATAGAE